MALECMVDGKHLSSIDGFTIFPVVPVSVGIVDGYESWYIRWRRVSICILGVATEKLVVKSCGERNEETLYWLFNTRGVCASKGVKSRCSTFGAVATIARPAFTTSSDAILPMRAEDNSTGGSVDRVAEHVEVKELVELFSFGL